MFLKLIGWKINDISGKELPFILSKDEIDTFYMKQFVINHAMKSENTYLSAKHGNIIPVSFSSASLADDESTNQYKLVLLLTKGNRLHRKVHASIATRS